jgi:5'-nucleotidase
MKILVTNDDGIDSPGLWAVVEELRRGGEVVVVAPQGEQSGVGTSVNLRRAIKVFPQARGKGIYTTDGTPIDCIIMAFRVLFPGEIDLVVSGINRGPNIGYDVFVSGTVAGALAGYFHGVPALAVSVDSYGEMDFGAAARLTALLAARIRKGDLPRESLMNVNLPNLPLGEIRGIEITKLGKQSHCGEIKKVLSGENEGYIIVKDKVIGEIDAGSDAWALEQKRISITPLLPNPWGNKSGNSLQELARDIFTVLVNAPITR